MGAVRVNGREKYGCADPMGGQIGQKEMGECGHGIGGLLASGVAQLAMRNSGEQAISRGVKEAIRVTCKDDGAYAFSNEFRFLVSHV